LNRDPFAFSNSSLLSTAFHKDVPGYGVNLG
jgi:hypothetical protein